MDYSLDDLFSGNIANSYYTDKQSVLLNEYITKFGHGIPMAYIPKSISVEELFEKIKICVETEKDNLLKLLNVTIDADCKY